MKKRAGLLEQLTEVPWWVSGIVAGVVYVGLRWVLPSIEYKSLLLKSLAASGPQVAWVFALLFLIPGLISFLKRKQRRHLLDTCSDLDSIRKLSWSDFELLIGEAFRRQAMA
jgi:restriction system protein